MMVDTFSFENFLFFPYPLVSLSHESGQALFMIFYEEAASLLFRNATSFWLFLNQLAIRLLTLPFSQSERQSRFPPPSQAEPGPFSINSQDQDFSKTSRYVIPGQNLCPPPFLASCRLSFYGMLPPCGWLQVFRVRGFLLRLILIHSFLKRFCDIVLMFPPGYRLFFEGMPGKAPVTGPLTFAFFLSESGFLMELTGGNIPFRRNYPHAGAELGPTPFL